MTVTAKQEQFCREYIIDLNATQAAIRAGYSKKNADKIGSQLLGKTRVLDRIAELKKENINRVASESELEIRADRTLLEIARIAYSDPRSVMEWGPDGVRLKPHDLAG